MPGAGDQIIVARDPAAFFRRAVDLFTVAVQKADWPSVALSGGSTPKKLFELLASADNASQVPWARVRFFWGDERCVGPTHADSNYRMANEALLSKVPVDPANVHRIHGEMDLYRAADAYEEVMAKVLPGHPFPLLDLNILGMGDDGHTASLFPGSPGLNEQKRWVVGHHIDKLNADRISMTFPVLNHARRTVVMITGAAKAGVVGEIFSGVGKYPIEKIKPVNGELIWLLDAPAAENLPPAARASATYI